MKAAGKLSIVPERSDTYECVAESLVSVTHDLLVKNGVRNTPEGVQVLLIADRLDHGAASSAAGIAALSREYTRILKEAVPPVSDNDEDEDVSAWEIV